MGGVLCLNLFSKLASNRVCVYNYIGFGVALYTNEYTPAIWSNNSRFVVGKIRERVVHGSEKYKSKVFIKTLGSIPWRGGVRYSPPHPSPPSQLLCLTPLCV